MARAAHLRAVERVRDAEDADDVWVVQAQHQLGLGLEGREARLGEPRAVQPLHRHRHAVVVGAQHLAEGAGAELRDDAERRRVDGRVAEEVGDLRSGGRGRRGASEEDGHVRAEEVGDLGGCTWSACALVSASDRSGWRESRSAVW